MKAFRCSASWMPPSFCTALTRFAVPMSRPRPRATAPDGGVTDGAAVAASGAWLAWGAAPPAPPKMDSDIPAPPAVETVDFSARTSRGSVASTWGVSTP
jgi:hypothetical protein